MSRQVLYEVVFSHEVDLYIATLRHRTPIVGIFVMNRLVVATEVAVVHKGTEAIDDGTFEGSFMGLEVFPKTTKAVSM